MGGKNRIKSLDYSSGKRAGTESFAIFCWSLIMYMMDTFPGKNNMEVDNMMATPLGLQFSPAGGFTPQNQRFPCILRNGTS